MSNPATANPNLVAADVRRLKLPTGTKYEPTHVSYYEARVYPSPIPSFSRSQKP
jgi:hypothetical protein